MMLNSVIVLLASVCLASAGKLTATQSSTANGKVAANAVDDMHRICSSTEAESLPWIGIGFGETKYVFGVTIVTPRFAPLGDFEIVLMKEDVPYTIEDIVAYKKEAITGKINIKFRRPRSGRFLAVRLRMGCEKRSLTVCEVIPRFSRASVRRFTDTGDLIPLLRGLTRLSSTDGEHCSAKAIDNDPKSCVKTLSEDEPSWSVKLPVPNRIAGISFVTDGMQNFMVALPKTDNNPFNFTIDDVVAIQPGSVRGKVIIKLPQVTTTNAVVIKMRKQANQVLSFCDFNIISSEAVLDEIEKAGRVRNVCYAMTEDEV